MPVLSSKFLKTLGPGVLFAGTSIGVSHLVQSTRAGADYGYLLIGVVLLANILKFPFFEFASRYSNVKKESILKGYQKMGKGVLWGYLVLTLLTMFTVCAAVTLVTAGMMRNLPGITLAPKWIALLLFIFIIFITNMGQYGWIDKMVKILGVGLLLSMLVAFCMTLFQEKPPIDPTFVPKGLWEDSSIFFLVALVGWMPTALDLSVWSSLWTIERIKQTGYQPTLKETRIEFHIGYWITALLAVLFLWLGYYMFYGSGEVLSNSPTVFAKQIVQMFSNLLGDWAFGLMVLVTFTTMFSTTVTVFDGYSRSLTKTLQLLELRQGKNPLLSLMVMVLLATVSLSLIVYFSDSLKGLIDLATTLSFLIAPVIAVLNYRLIFNRHFPKENQPSLWLKILALLGIVFLTVFSFFYLWLKIS